MQVEQMQILLPDSLGGLICAANRYTSAQPSPQRGGYTLVFAHCSSAHKEQWIVTIQKLFDLTMGTSMIHEAWALDLPSHGDSALLNQDKLRRTRPVSVQDYGNLLHYFSCSSYVSGHSLLAVGHSASTAAWCFAWTQSPKPPIEAFIMIEPVMVPPPITPDDPRISRGARNVKAVLSRLNRWNNMDALAAWMNKRYPWKIWDKRILNIYLTHGFMTVSNGSSSYITSRIPVEHEAQLYKHHDFVTAGEIVHEICSRIPMHYIFSERPEMVSLKSREILSDASRGRNIASLSIVPKAGHLAVQENPEGVAIAVYNILKRVANGRARL